MIICDSKIIITVGSTNLIDSKIKIIKSYSYALIGPNGCGKTTILKWIKRKLSSTIRIGYIEQDIITLKTNKTVLEYLISTDTYRKDLLNQKTVIEKLLYDDSDIIDNKLEELDSDDIQRYSDQLRDIDEELRNIKSYSAENEAKKILIGLEFDLKALANELSGGWLMRLQLASLLYLNSDLILLDEPTNHLDFNTIQWLIEYLNMKKISAVIISHDQYFLNQVCNRWITILDKKIIQTKTLKFSDVIKPKKSIFNFNDNIKYGYFKIELHNVGFGYETELFSDIDLCIDYKSKIGIVGANGSGKSTLLKLISGEIKPTTGEININRKLNIFRLSQIFEANSNLNSIEFLKKFTKKSKIRNILGRSGLKGKQHTIKISDLSGGQKAKLMIAKIIAIKPSILLLDEPTNHLDLEGIHILILALKQFNGGIVVVSHNQYIINEVCNEIYELKNKKMNLHYIL